MPVTRRWLLPFDSLAPAAARARVAGVRGHTDDAELVASELVGNAVRHGHPPIELELTATDTLLRLAVTATHHPGDTIPVARAHPDGSGGAGLRIVEACAQAWSWELLGARLTVRADVRLR